MLKVAVLMRTKNSSWVIAQTLNALFSQKGVDFKLYIIDSGSTDNTEEICRRFPHHTIQMKQDEYIPGPIINWALEHINEKIIVMLNSDSVLLTPNSLKLLIEPLIESNEVVASVGRQIPRPEAEPWVVKDYQYSFPETKKAPNHITLSFPLSAFKRKVWEKEKFYEESWGSEDTEWGKRILDKKLGKIVYVPKSITMHSHNYTNKEIHNRKFIEGEADFFIYRIKPNVIKIIYSFVKRSLSEILYYIKTGNILSTYKILIRNYFYFLGYYRGLKNALNRSITNCEKVVHRPY